MKAAWRTIFGSDGMFLFALLMLVNFTVSNDLLFDYRLELLGMPLNVLDGLIVLVLLRQLFRSRREAMATHRTHPLLYWSMALCLGAMLLGTMGAMIHEVGLRYLFNS